MKPKYKRLLAALLAIAAVYVVKATGLDQGLIDEAIQGVIEAVSEEAPVAPEGQ